MSLSAKRQIPMKWKWLANLGIGVFLAYNLYFPLQGLGTEKTETWGEFTWNMYSQTYRCAAKYYLLQDDGTAVNVDVRPYMRRGEKMGRVFHREVLPKFHAYLCEQLEAEGRSGTLMGDCYCNVAGGTTERLVDTTANLCNAEDHGVLTTVE